MVGVLKHWFDKKMDVQTHSTDKNMDRQDALRTA